MKKVTVYVIVYGGKIMFHTSLPFARNLSPRKDYDGESLYDDSLYYLQCGEAFNDIVSQFYM
jgi:hypothetical protein